MHFIAMPVFMRVYVGLLAPTCNYNPDGIWIQGAWRRPLKSGILGHIKFLALLLCVFPSSENLR